MINNVMIRQGYSYIGLGFNQGLRVEIERMVMNYM